MEPRTSTTDFAYRHNGAGAYYQPTKPAKDRYWLHLLLFMITFASTIYAGGEMAQRILLYQHPDATFEFLGFTLNALYLLDGFRYGFALLLFLTVHEFGHYFAARYHKVGVSLPYYIPFPFNFIGTFGAVIRIREPVPSMRKLFDIGAAGPLAGFVVALGVLLYGLATLPPPEYIMDLDGHAWIKGYLQMNGRFPTEMPPASDQGLLFIVGQTPLYWFLSQFFEGVPPMYEMYHYPVLFAGWLALFFTALNLLPVGQLDGGHILYALVGPKWHGRLARGFVLLLLLSGAIGFMNDLAPSFYESSEWLGRSSWFILAAILYFYLNRVFDRDHRVIAPVLLGMILLVVLAQFIGPAAQQVGYWGWLFWCLLIIFLIRIDHPPVLYVEPLTPMRRALGIFSIIVFFLCFSLKPFYIV